MPSAPFAAAQTRSSFSPSLLFLLLCNPYVSALILLSCLFFYALSVNSAPSPLIVLLRPNAARASRFHAQFGQVFAMDSPQSDCRRTRAPPHRWRCRRTHSIAPSPTSILAPARESLAPWLPQTSLRQEFRPSICGRFPPASWHILESSRQPFAPQVLLPAQALPLLPTVPAFRSPAQSRALALRATPLALRHLQRNEGQAVVDCAAPFWEEPPTSVPRPGLPRASRAGRSRARKERHHFPRHSLQEP